METIQCPICGKESTSPWVQVVDRLNPNDDTKYSITKCDCGLFFLNPRFDSSQISEFYNLDNYDPHQINASGIYHTIYKFVMKVALYFKYKTISKYVKKGTLLDVGGGGGEFCNYFKSFGWNVTMLETSKPARDNAIALGINTVSGFSEIEPDQRFDLITLWHSLEHIHDLDELFNNIKKYLKPDGYVIFAVPNILANERKYYPDSWAAYDAPRHLYHFSPSSLKAILQKYQIQIIQSFPLFQDTPYNILHSMPEKNIAQALKAIFICCETLLKIFFKGNHFASSLEVICNLKSS